MSSDNQQTVTAIEPAWVKQEYRIEANGDLEPVSECVHVHSIDMLFDEATYRLADGTELQSWYDLTELCEFKAKGLDPAHFLLAHGYIDIDDDTAKFFEAPEVIFEEYDEQYQMASGGMGKLVSLSPDGAKFAWVNNGDKTEFYPSRLNDFESLVNESNRDVKAVGNEAKGIETAQQEGSPTTWKRIEDTDRLIIGEYVPFEDRVTTRDELQEALDEAMLNAPDLSKF